MTSPPPSLPDWLGFFTALSLEILLVSLVAGLIDPFLSRPRARRRLWQTVFLLFLFLSVARLTGLTNLFPTPHFRNTSWTRSDPLSPSGERASLPAVAAAKAGVRERQNNVSPSSLPVHPAEPRERVADLSRFEKDLTSNPAPSPGRPAIAQRPKPPAVATSASQSGLEKGTWFPAYFWLAGTLTMLLPAMFGSLALLLRAKPGQVSGPLAARVMVLARRFHLRHAPRLVALKVIRTPLAFRLFRPAIALPVDFQQNFSEQEQEVILAHEIGHLAANDPCWRLLAEIVRALLWWHPAVWWGLRHLEAATEMAADEAAAVSSAQPRVLAECLVRLGGQELLRRCGGGVGMSGFRTGLGQRVEHLLLMEESQMKEMSGAPPRSRALGAAVSLLLLIAFCGAWTGQAVEDRITGKNHMKNLSLQRGWWKTSLARLFLTATVGAAGAGSAPAAQNLTLAEPNQAPPGPKQSLNATSASPTGAPDDNLVRRRVAITNIDPNVSRYGLDPSPANNKSDPRSLWSEQMYKRYGIPPPDQGVSLVNAANRNQRLPSSKTDLIKSRLENIELDEVSFDALPLSEVIRFLIDESARRDPEKRGVNFMISQGRRSPPPATIDPTTGQPVSVSTGEVVDLRTVVIRINPPLKHVSLIDVLDAITKVSDQPLAYHLEPYGVIFTEATPEAQNPVDSGEDARRLVSLERGLSSQQLAAYAEADADHAALSMTLQKLKELQRADPRVFWEALPICVPDTQMASLLDSFKATQQKLVLAEQAYGPGHSEVIRYSTLLKKLEEQLKESADRTLLALEVKAEAAKARADKLNENFRHRQQSNLSLPRDPAR